MERLAKKRSDVGRMQPASADLQPLVGLDRQVRSNVYVCNAGMNMDLISVLF